MFSHHVPYKAVQEPNYIKYEWSPTSGIKTLRYEEALTSTMRRHTVACTLPQ